MSGMLSGAVAVVTGAGRGIGRAIAVGFAGEGAAVCCLARSTKELEATVNAIEAAGGTARAYTVDVTDADVTSAAYDDIAGRYGGFDLLVLNAGADLARGPVETSDPKAWQRTVEVNLFGPYHGARLAVPHLRRRGGGKIIMIGSGLGHSSLHGSGAYSCSKAALWMLTRILADELRADGITVNELIPGPVRTTATAAPAAPNSVFNVSGEWVKEPGDVVPMALFLATQPPSGPTGQSFSLTRRTF